MVGGIFPQNTKLTSDFVIPLTGFKIFIKLGLWYYKINSSEKIPGTTTT